MLILALESSAKPASVAVCSDGEMLGQYFQNSALTHSRTLLAMAESLLKNLGINAADIELVAVSRGPGSFTGIRIGVSAAKGLAWGIGKPVCGVSTLEAMAYQTQGIAALVCPVMDARRGQVYNALFACGNGKPTRLCEDRAISLQDLAGELRAHPTNSTYSPPPDSARPLSLPYSPPPDSALPPLPSSCAPGSPLLLVGDGADKSLEYLESAGIPCIVAPSLIRWQTAYGVALAALHAEAIPPAELEPCYLRPSQAERERANHGAL